MDLQIRKPEKLHLITIISPLLGVSLLLALSTPLLCVNMENHQGKLIRRSRKEASSYLVIFSYTVFHSLCVFSIALHSYTRTHQKVKEGILPLLQMTLQRSCLHKSYISQTRCSAKFISS
jgi:hypothetical protein